MAHADDLARGGHDGGKVRAWSAGCSYGAEAYTQWYQHEIPFGVVDCDDAGFVTGISEKPTISVDINTAVYAVDADALELLPDGRPSTMPELVQQLLDRGDRVATWTMSSDWIDVGTPKDLARAKGQA